MNALIPYFAYQQWLSNRMHGQQKGFSMFLDLTGFTALTETLMNQGVEGAEELSQSLNSIFAPMVQLVYAKGGIIPYFAGDSFNALFFLEDEDPGLLAEEVLETAQQLIHFYEEEGLRETRFGQFKIGLKIGIGFGNIEWGIVGDEMHTFYFRGSAIHTSSSAQSMAKDHNIVVDAKIEPYLRPSDWQFIAIDDAFNYLPLKRVEHKLRKVPALGLPDMERSVLTNFLPPAVLDFDQPGEFRDVISVFISFKGVKQHEELNLLASVIINRISGFSGYFKEIDFGDKGGVMVAFFGAPVTFENNIRRALECVLSLQYDLARLRDIELPDLLIRFGITYGTAFTGIVGGKERCQYAAVGNLVNIAARLMVNAEWGEILVDARIAKERGFHFEHKGNIRYKGVYHSVPTYEVMGQQVGIRETYDKILVGRSSELNSMEEFVQPVLLGSNARLIYVFGEAGIGKSRVLYELSKKLESYNYNWYVFQSDQILRKPYNLFIYLLSNFFRQSSEKNVDENRKVFEKRFYEFRESVKDLPNAQPYIDELDRTRPVLAALLGAPYPDSLWNLLDARGRSENTQQAIVNILQLLTMEKPVVFEMEDAHWMDDSSINLFDRVLSKLRNTSVIFLITSRPDDAGNNIKIIPSERLQELDLPELTIDLHALSEADLEKYAQDKLQGKVHPDFIELLKRNTNGNPFYAEQMIEFLSESGALFKEDDSWQVKDNGVKLTSSITNVLIARIDRLSALVKETVKAAAVIGREFEVPILSEVMAHQLLTKNNTDGQPISLALDEQIKKAERGQIWRAMNELRYIFRHALLREAAYDMQLRGQLRQLHALIAQAIEKVYANNIEERYVDLAFHYEQAHERNATIKYLKKAANYFKKNFQNDDALKYYNRLYEYLPKSKVKQGCKTLLNKSSILRTIGDWEACKDVLMKALKLAKKSKDKGLIGKSYLKIGHFNMLRGNYEDAQAYLTNAIDILGEESSSIVKAFGHMGELYFRQGQYEQAKLYFLKCLELPQSKKEHRGSLAHIATNLGLVFMNQGEYEDGIKHMQEHLLIALNAKDKAGSAFLYTHMGIVYYESNKYDEALKCYEKGLELSKELGNLQLQAIAIGCLGNVYQQKGKFDKALELFQEDMEICKQLGDKQGISIVYGLLGDLYKIRGNFDEAIDCLEKNLEISEALGYKKGSAKAYNSLGDIYDYIGLYKESLDNYQKSISISREMSNKLILGKSLIEAASPMMKLSMFEEATANQREAAEIAKEIENTELMFDVHLFEAKLLIAMGETRQAKENLESLLPIALRSTAIAAVYYQLWRLQKEGEAYYAGALERYERLHEQSPTYLINSRLQELKKYKESQ